MRFPVSRVCAWAVAALAAGCGEHTVTTSVRAASMDLSSVGMAAVNGMVDGQRFTLQDAWFRVDRRAGRERVDMILSEGRRSRLCGDSSPESARHVWIRFHGVTQVATGELRSDPSEAHPRVSAHVETQHEEKWVGRTGAVAIKVDSIEGERIAGTLRACFGPGTEGCVSGSFSASACRTELELDGPLAGQIRRPEDHPPRAAGSQNAPAAPAHEGTQEAHPHP